RDDIESEPGASAFGTLLHEVLKAVVDQGPCSPEHWQARCEAELSQRIRRSYGSEARMSLTIFEHAARARLRAAGEVQLALWEEGWRTRFSEWKVKRTCAGIPIHGTLDRVDVHPEKGYRIIDYKTHDQPEPPAKTHLGPPREGRESIQLELGDRTRQWIDLQLPLYRWLAAGQPEIDASRPLEVCYFNLPKSTKDTGIEGWAEEPALAPQAEEGLQSVLQLIQNQVWTPTSKATPYDDFTPLLHHGSDWIPQKV
ncbi:MAG: PD-(D/E)XK nuclease family protein, partial [Kiritimatiellia bacterium]